MISFTLNEYGGEKKERVFYFFYFYLTRKKRVPGQYHPSPVACVIFMSVTCSTEIDAETEVKRWR